MPFYSLGISGNWKKLIGARGLGHVKNEPQLYVALRSGQVRLG